MVIIDLCSSLYRDDLVVNMLPIDLISSVKVISKDAGQLASDLCNKYSILIKDCSGKASIEDQYIRVAVRDTRDNELLISSLKALA